MGVIIGWLETGVGLTTEGVVGLAFSGLIKIIFGWYRYLVRTSQKPT